MPLILIRVIEKSGNLDPEVLFEALVERSFRIGRQEVGETDEIGFVECKSNQAGIDLKLIIASVNEREYSRNFAEVLFLDDRLEIRNTSGNQTIFLGSAEPINPDESRWLAIPCECTIVNRSICFLGSGAKPEGSVIFSLASTPPPPGQHSGISPHVSLVQASRGNHIDGKRLLELLQAMLEVFQDSPSRREFFERSAQAMVQLLELDHVLVAFLAEHAQSYGVETEEHTNGWCSQTRCFAGRDDFEWVPSLQILDTIKKDKRTVFQVPDVRTESLIGVKCLVASPLLNTVNDVIGVVYGDRVMTGANQMLFGESEAKFVELFANGISAGLARLNQERQLSEMRSRFDQFFTPNLARQLESDATMLDPRSAEVSVLFADIRGFSRISERIGPEKTIHWINSVLSQLSDCVFKYEGVVVDYIGDEIMAMWGAPIDRENHAELAVRAALEMLRGLPEINRQWEEVIGEPVEIGIGVNSGEAQVGNTGSDRKFKYGPLGNVVNVCSRLQGATKQLKASLLLTESTAGMLPVEIPSRRIRSVRFVNVNRAFRVYEVPLQPDDEWNALKQEYEKGLQLYETGQLHLASQQMAAMINRFPADGPTMLLLSDTVGALSQNSPDFDPVWELPHK